MLPAQQRSATNLAHYIGLRKQSVRQMQLDLAGMGLSSLGRSEGHVRDTFLRLAGWLETRRAGSHRQFATDQLDTNAAETILHENTRALFGPRPADRHVYVMVTAPDANEVTREWADKVLRAGANILRINAAHESPAEWRRVVDVIRASAAATGTAVKVFVDLPGPKLRAEIRRTQAAVLHFPRRKDRLGKTISPTAVLLVPDFVARPQVPIPREWFGRMRAGDRLRMHDAGGRARELVIRQVSAEQATADCDRSLYIAPGLVIEWRRGRRLLGRGRIGAIPREPGDILLNCDDRFVVNETGRANRDARLPVLLCPEPGMLKQVKRGERVVLDDGRIIAVVESTAANSIVCRVTQTAKSPVRLRSGKGLAFPDSHLSLAALGAEDQAALEFALACADGVEMSFVNSKRDVDRIVAQLRKNAPPGFGLVLKLETQGAIRNLPDILFAALRYSPVGLMIARGDLAVEASFEQLAQLQEDILGFGEACHLPVIWATQVLDSLAHSGVPTRAEVTDAAMSMRAECVMLNKGPFVADATRMLVKIIRDMEPRQYKKRALFSKLAEK
ncbi:MAG: pyruvate kinase [Betaproteobacteria bacterium]|nr:pyruvate kinase [Betaproteobacteria bacterium]